MMNKQVRRKDRAAKRIRTRVKLGDFHFAEGELWSKTKCESWHHNWPSVAQKKFVHGLAIGLAWWMWWEEETAKAASRKGQEEAWAGARQVIAKNDVMKEILDELHEYCKTVTQFEQDKADKDKSPFLKAVPQTIWKVVERYGAPVPKLEDER